MSTRQIVKIASIIGLAFAASGCLDKAPSAAAAKADQSIDQGSICQVTDWRPTASASCKPGQKIAFFPQTFGNAQLPVLFAAANCDLRYSVALTNGAVACIYAPLKPETEKTEPAASGTSK